MAPARSRGTDGAGPMRVGLTGGIACGKSVVLRRLASAGIDTLDLDSVGRDLLRPGGAGFAPVVSTFGESIVALDGSIDRKRLGERVFRDDEERCRLEGILHPLIRQAEERHAARLHGDDVLVVDGALLVEAGMHLRFARVVVVHCDRTTQLARLMARDRIEEGAARIRIGAQMDVTERRAFGHIEVDSSGGLSDTERRADEVAEEIRRLAQARRRQARPLAFAHGMAALQHGFADGPRSLSPGRLLEVLLREDGVDLRALAEALEPPSSGRWYQGATEVERSRAEALAAPLVIWAASRRDADAEWLASAASSLARLTHRDRVCIAGACLAALAMSEVVSQEGGATPWWRPSVRTRELAARWGGADADAAIERSVQIGCRWAQDPASARREALIAGCDADLAGAVAGLVGGRTTRPWPPAFTACLDRLTTRAK